MHAYTKHLIPPIELYYPLHEVCFKEVPYLDSELDRGLDSGLNNGQNLKFQVSEVILRKQQRFDVM